MKPAAPAFNRLARAAACRAMTLAPDGELLRSFLVDHDSDAFAAIVKRHGPMVLGLCRQLTRDIHVADDAFQAVFLSLSRKAGAIRRPEALPAWLFGVAHRIALKARALRERRKTVPPGEIAVEADPLDRMSARELIDALHTEMAGLPLNYRSALVLCTIEGKSIEDAARQLGSTPGAVRGSLQRGRDRLKDRLARRGLAPTALSTAGILLPSTRLDAHMANSAIQLGNTGAVVPPAIAALVPGTVSASMKLATVALLAVGAAGIGISLLPGAAAPPDSKPQPMKTADSPTVATPVKTDAPPVDRLGDPLPEGALARLGTLRLRHGATICSVAFSGDNKLLASGGFDGFVNVWDARTGRRQIQVVDPNFAKTPGGLGAPLGVAFSPDGACLAVAWLNSPPSLWDVRTGKKRRDIGGPRSRASGVEFSADGKYLVTKPYDVDYPAILAEVETGNEIFSAPGQIILLPGGFVHVDPNQPRVSLRKLGDNAASLEFKGHEGKVTAAALAPDGKRLITHGSDRTIRIWDTTTAKELHRLDTALDAVRRIIPAPDVKNIVTLSADGSSMQYWEVASGKARWTAKVDAQWNGFRHALFLPGGSVVVTGHDYGRIRLWDVGTGNEQKVVHAHFSDVRCLALSPDGLTLATTTSTPSDNRVHLWDPATLAPKTEQQGHTQQVFAAVFSPDGRIVATAGSDRSVRLWEPRTGNPIRTIETSTMASPFFTPDGKVLITGGRTEGAVHFWDVETGKEIRKFKADPKGAILLALSPDGKQLFTSGSDDRLRCWDASTFEQLGEFRDENPNQLLRMALSPDGSTLATAHLDQVLRIWDARTFKKRYQLKGGATSHIGAIAFSPDNSLLAWTDDVAGIRLTDVASGNEVRRLPGRANSFDQIAFAPDGKTLAWGISTGLPANSKAVQIWEVRTGELRRTWDGHDGPAAPLAYSPNGRLLVTAGADGAALVWDVRHARDKKQAFVKPSAEKLGECWDVLAETNAAKAFECMETFVQCPDQGVAWIAQHLKPIPRAPSEKVAALLRDLESDTFKIREAATRALEQLDEAIIVDLQQLAKKSQSADVRNCAERLLARIENGRLQRERAIEVLEMIGNAAAVKLLKSLADGQPDAPLTRDARWALRRLDTPGK